MLGRKESIEDFLTRLGIEYSPVSDVEKDELNSRWLATFARNVKREKGQLIFRGFRWHGFSYGIEKCVEGEEALAQYFAQWPADYYIFDEELTFCFRCKSEAYPDLSPRFADLYVIHGNLKWTMVFTHEQPELGPYFATGDATK